MSDNFHFDISSEGREHFDMAMGFAFCHWRLRVAERFLISPKNGLVLCWKEGPIKTEKLPYPMNQQAATEFAWNWLDTADYGPEPDHDGSNKKGWRVYNDQWRRVDVILYSFVGIQPCWMMHGK